MALEIPANDAAMARIVELNQEDVQVMSIQERYTSRDALLCLLARIGCDIRERFHALHDGFNSINDIVDLYGNNTDAFKKHLLNSNKTWMNSSLTKMRAFFTPIVINRFVGVIYYFRCAVKLFHTIPDREQIAAELSTRYGLLYINSSSDDEEDAQNVELQLLNEAKDWTSFKDNFLMLLSTTKGSRGITIDYIIDTTPTSLPKVYCTSWNNRHPGSRG
jgi:hypothetical protein